MSVVDWEWDAIHAVRPGVSGDLAKLFKHEAQKTPGVFQIGAPPDAATLLAREVIQNSWDAARELNEADGTDRQFEIEFRFRALVGDEKVALVESLGLASLAGRVSQIGRSDIGLRDADCLISIDDIGEPLRILEIVEHGATGMYGSWDQADSHMYRALLSLGFTEKRMGAGGSYGYGKAGLISGSKIRSVVAYSCFREVPQEPGVTRRLLGMTYWGGHIIDGVRYTGFGSLSDGAEGEIRPFINEDADDLAESLVMVKRIPDETDQLGTTFLIVDPTVEPEDLVRAVERSWWPAIVEGDLAVRVRDYGGNDTFPRPAKDEVLRTFIDAWELAKGTRTKGPEDWKSELTGPGSEGVVGTIGLVADLQGWSYADQTVGPDEEQVDHRSLIALTRGPRMVVEYFDAGRSHPYLRGVFIADPALDNTLRLTEPKAHDSWQTKSEDGEIHAEAIAVAKHVLDRIKSTVANHRQRLKPSLPPPDAIRLDVFNDIMRRIMSGAGSAAPLPPPRDDRPISIHLNYQPVAVGDEIRLVGSASFAFSEHFQGDLAEVELSIRYQFMEDDKAGLDAHLDFKVPEGFAESAPGIFEGSLTRGPEVRFEFESELYHPSWTGKLVVDGTVLDADDEMLGEGA